MMTLRERMKARRQAERQPERTPEAWLALKSPKRVGGPGWPGVAQQKSAANTPRPKHRRIEYVQAELMLGWSMDHKRDSNGRLI